MLNIDDDDDDSDDDDDDDPKLCMWGIWRTENDIIKKRGFIIKKGSCIIKRGNCCHHLLQNVFTSIIYHFKLF